MHHRCFCVAVLSFLCACLLYADGCSDVISSVQCKKLKPHICGGTTAQLCRKTCCMCPDWVDKCAELVTSVTCSHLSVRTLCVRTCCQVSEWLNWSEWSTCSKTCNGGTRNRIRTCSKTQCEGNAIETTPCNTPLCPEWSQWGSWSDCSSSCSEGVAKRSRSCGNSSQQNCVGSSQEVKRCFLPPCAPTLSHLAVATSRDGSLLGDAVPPCRNPSCNDTKCLTGFKWSALTQECEDINECSFWNGGCDETCVNSPGSFSCIRTPPPISGSSCVDGYSRRYGKKNGCCISDEEDYRMERGCGRNTEDDLQRIVGGEDAKLGRWPWMARLLIGERNLCGGTLVHHRWVLSAAHCFKDHDVLRHGAVVISVGMFNQTLKYERSRQIRVDKTIVVHPMFNFPENDIALIQVDRPFDVTIFASPVCLPNGELPTESKVCYATGFGTLGFKGELAPVLQQVALPIVNKHQCRRSYLSRGWNLKEYQFCAGDQRNGGKDSCQGDSGGPLVCQRCSTCRWYIAGVTSFGHGCANPGFPGVYISVERFEGWIAMETGMVVGKNRSCTLLAEWGKWSSWSSCTKTCNSGWKTRERFCVRQGLRATDGECGRGQPDERRRCNTNKCPTWSAWGDWSPCTTSCGTSGVRQKSRICLNGVPESCQGTNVTTSQCNKRPCPTWSPWTSWSSCSETCGTTGLKQKFRRCLYGNTSSCGGGGKIRNIQCNIRPCPKWGSWGPWGACSATCGHTGQRLRHRYCENGMPGNAGCSSINSTSGAENNVTSLNMTSQSTNCDVGPCYQWSQWLSWGSCSQSCGRGQINRGRNCLEVLNEPSIKGVTSATRNRTNKTNYLLGDDCAGFANETKECEQIVCPKWSQWGNWTSCTVTCGGGIKFRLRDCLNANGNDSCLGNSTQGTFCNTQTCPPLSCPEIRNFSNGNVECSNATFVGSQCFFDCFSGYVIKGVPVTQCDDDGKWSVMRPECTKMQLNVDTFEQSRKRNKATIDSLSSGMAGTWMVNEVGNVFYLNNSIGYKVFSKQDEKSLGWIQVDKRGLRSCQESVNVNNTTQVRVVRTTVTISIPDCGRAYERRGISPTSPTGWYWQQVRGFPTNKGTKKFKSDATSWKLSQNGELTASAPPDGLTRIEEQTPEDDLTGVGRTVNVSNPTFNRTKLRVEDFCVASKYVFVVTQDGQVYHRAGISNLLPEGMDWTPLSTKIEPRKGKTSKYVISCVTSQWEDRVVVWMANGSGMLKRYMMK